MDERERTKIIKTLLQLTKTDKLEWNLSSPPSSLTDGSESIIPVYFTSEFKGRRMGVFEIRRRDYDGNTDNFYWFTSVALVIFAPSPGQLLVPSRSWNGGVPVVEIYQPQSVLVDLLEAARDKSADLGGFLEELKSELPEDDDAVPF